MESLFVPPLLLLLLPVLPLLLFTSSCSAASSEALLASIAYDPTTTLYSTQLVRPSRPLLLDLDDSILWLDCVNPPYDSPTWKPVRCRSALCNKAKVCSSLVCGGPSCVTCFGPLSPVCVNDTCGTSISNSAISTSTSSNVLTDTVSLLATDGRNPGEQPVDLPQFAFGCADDLLLRNGSVPAGVGGAAALSRAALALPTQVAAKRSLKRRFAYCLPSSGSGRGVLFFGQSSGFVFLPGIDVAPLLHYAPLLSDPAEPDTYFLPVKGISVNGAALPINANLLKIKSGGGGGGARISSTLRYTALEPSIYAALVSAFTSASAARGIRAVPAVAPFGACFNASTASSTRVGFNVPEIDLALQGSGGPTWQIFGANSVVMVSDNVFCLAFQQRREFEPRSLILGTFQQQDAFIQFDLATSRIGFLSTLLGIRTTCSNFNFTASPLA